MYPLVAGVTRSVGKSDDVSEEERAVASLDDWKGMMGTGAVIEALKGRPSEEHHFEDEMRSEHFQWLPAEVIVAKDGQVTWSSYINNLHPEKHAHMYIVFADALQSSLPLLERVLADLVKPPPHRLEGVEPGGWHHGLERLEDWEQRVLHTRRDGTGDDSKMDVEGGRQLQVIVKLAEIRLTPDTPSYDGGNWHIEGMSNEEIVATVVHYYDSENVRHAGLDFRCAIDGNEAISPRRSVHRQCWQDGARSEYLDWEDERADAYAYGLEEGKECNQDIGFLTTFEGRSIAFPNLYQHRVGPVELIDKTKPGHRRILVFWLVHPFYRVISTAIVPPQQSSWFAESDSACRRVMRVHARLTIDLRRARSVVPR